MQITSGSSYQDDGRLQQMLSGGQDPFAAQKAQLAALQAKDAEFQKTMGRSGNSPEQEQLAELAANIL